MSKSATLTLIAAVSADGFISRGHGVPWDLPRDRAHFRKHTAGQWLLLGRRTYGEMLGWFRNHTPLVLTHDMAFQPAIGQVVHSIQDAIQAATASSVREIFVCGGSAAYTLAMPHANRLLITHVETQIGSGVAFPVISSDWQVISEHFHPADMENVHALRFVEYSRVV